MKVKAKIGAVSWFQYPITVGKIYDFPNIVFDNSDTMNLSLDKGRWEKEFEFLDEEVINEDNILIFN